MKSLMYKLRQRIVGTKNKGAAPICINDPKTGEIKEQIKSTHDLVKDKSEHLKSPKKKRKKLSPSSNSTLVGLSLALFPVYPATHQSQNSIEIVVK